MNLIAQQPLHIAIVEDDVVFRGIVSSMLTRETQFRVFEAELGQALDQILSEATIDCILLDYNLGDDNGFALRGLRAVLRGWAYRSSTSSVSR
jgi:DNA-binding response OmpR family regulator